MKTEYLEILIDHLRNNQKFQFNDLSNFLLSKIEDNSIDEFEFMTELNQELATDNRFFLYSEGWGLREDMTEDLIKKSNNSFTYTADDVFLDKNSNYSSTNSEILSFSHQENYAFNKKNGKNKIENMTTIINDGNTSKLNNSKKKRISQELGYTEDIDWDSVDNYWKENN